MNGQYQQHAGAPQQQQQQQQQGTMHMFPPQGQQAQTHTSMQMEMQMLVEQGISRGGLPAGGGATGSGSSLSRKRRTSSDHHYQQHQQREEDGFPNYNGFDTGAGEELEEDSGSFQSKKRLHMSNLFDDCATHKDRIQGFTIISPDGTIQSPAGAGGGDGGGWGGGGGWASSTTDSNQEPGGFGASFGIADGESAPEVGMGGDMEDEYDMIDSLRLASASPSVTIAGAGPISIDQSASADFTQAQDQAPDFQFSFSAPAPAVTSLTDKTGLDHRQIMDDPLAIPQTKDPIVPKAATVAATATGGSNASQRSRGTPADGRDASGSVRAYLHEIRQSDHASAAVPFNAHVAGHDYAPVPPSPLSRNASSAGDAGGSTSSTALEASQARIDSSHTSLRQPGSSSKDDDEAMDQDNPPSTSATTRSATTIAIEEKCIQDVKMRAAAGQKNQVRYTFGYRKDCEKCRARTPGHFTHILRVPAD